MSNEPDALPPERENSTLRAAWPSHTKFSRSGGSAIERVVMRRVRMAHALRPLLSGGALALAIFVFALWGIGREVWVAQVFANAPHAGILASFKFFLYAFENTRITVQALSLAAFFGMLWFFRDLFRAATTAFATSHV